MAQPSVIDKIMSGASSLVRGTQKLLSPTDIDSQIELSDLQTQPAPETWEDKKLRQLGNQRYEEARQGRFLVNEKIFTGLAFYNGVHDHYYNAGAGRMMPINEGSSDLKERFVYKPKNFIPVYVQRAESRILAEKPDAWASPMTDSDSDKKAAATARSCVTHAHRKLNIDALLRQVVRRMLITTTTFVEIGWDNKAYADIGIPQADGSVSYHYEQIGDVCANVRLAIDAYPDPNAALNGKGIDGGAYFITRSLESIENIFAKWGKRVEADSQSDVNMWLQQRIEWISGTYTRAASSQKNSAVVTQVWEKPSGQFPEGRFWVYSGETVLHKGPWPYTKGVARHKYPFVEFYYDENVGSIWGLNMVSNLIPIQMAINDQSTYMNGRLAWDRPTILAPRNANIAPDDYNDIKPGQLLYKQGKLHHQRAKQ